MLIAPYGRNFRGAGGRSDRCSVKAWVNKKFLSVDVKIDRESLIRTVCGSEFQTDDAENRKACLEKCVLVNGWTSGGLADEREVRLQTRSVICSAPQVNIVLTMVFKIGIGGLHDDLQASWCMISGQKGRRSELQGQKIGSVLVAPSVLASSLKWLYDHYMVI